MRNNKLKYSELSDALKTLGFEKKNNASNVLFFNKKYDALFVMPSFTVNETVKPYQVSAFKKMIVEKGIISESKFEDIINQVHK